MRKITASCYDMGFAPLLFSILSFVTTPRAAPGCQARTCGTDGMDTSTTVAPSAVAVLAVCSHASRTPASFLHDSNETTEGNPRAEAQQQWCRRLWFAAKAKTRCRQFQQEGGGLQTNTRFAGHLDPSRGWR